MFVQKITRVLRRDGTEHADKEWSHEESEQARIWLEVEGLSESAVGKRLGRTKNSVSGRKRRQGWCNGAPPKVSARTVWTPELRAQALAMAQASPWLSSGQIAQHFGVRRQTLHDHLTKAGHVRERAVKVNKLPSRPRWIEPQLFDDPAAPIPLPRRKAEPMTPIRLPVQYGLVRTCQRPLWGDYERPTHEYCGAEVVKDQGGNPFGVYCAACRSRLYVRVAA